MKTGKKRKELLLWIVCVSVWLFAWEASAGPLSFNGTVSSSHPADGDSTTSVSQNTSASFSQQLTPLISLEESLRYTTRWYEGTENETIFPTVGLHLNNDLFSFNLSGSANKQRSSEQTNRSNSSWNSRWNSNWQQRWLPQVNLNYGQDFAKDDESPHRQNTDSTDSGANFDWDIVVGTVSYSVNRTESNDNVAESVNTSTNQMARFSTGKSFFQDRVQVSFSEQFTQYNQKFSSMVSSSGYVPVPFNFIEMRGGWDDVDVDDEPDWDDLGPGLPPVIHDQRYNIAFQIGAADEVDTIYLSTLEDLTSEANLFDWQVYTSTNGLDWTLTSSSAVFVYNTFYQRFEIDIPLVTDTYVMLVEDDIPTVDDFTFTGGETFVKLYGTVGEEVSTSSETTRFNTQAGLNWIIDPTLSMAYNINLENGVTASDEDDDRVNQNCSFNWKPALWFSSSLNISESREQVGNEEESVNRSYGFSSFTRILPSLDMGLGMTRSENYEGGERQTLGHNFNLHTTAVFFPDLTSSLNLGYNTSLNDESGIVTKNFTGTFRLMARLTSRVSADFNQNYTKSLSEDSTWSTGSRASLNWRPADIFSFRASASKDWDNGEAGPLSYGAGFSLAATRTMQFNGSYSHGESSDAYSLGLNWTINRVFSFQSNCNYQDGDNSGLSYSISLNMRY